MGVTSRVFQKTTCKETMRMIRGRAGVLELGVRQHPLACSGFYSIQGLQFCSKAFSTLTIEIVPTPLLEGYK